MSVRISLVETEGNDDVGTQPQVVAVTLHQDVAIAARPSGSSSAPPDALDPVTMNPAEPVTPPGWVSRADSQPVAGPSVRCGRAQQAVHVVFAQRLWQPLGALRAFDPNGRVVAPPAFLEGKAVKLPDRRQPPPGHARSAWRC